jgi:hypothetical protein
VAYPGVCTAEDLIINQVPASLLTADPVKTNSVPQPSSANPQPNRKQQETLEDRWQKFEGNFGINTPAASPVKSTLQSAKYRLDETTFALQEFLDNVTDTLRFDYGLRDLTTKSATTKSDRGTSGSALYDSLTGARFKSDINLKLAGRQFVGVKLVLPIGD